MNIDEYLLKKITDLCDIANIKIAQAMRFTFCFQMEELKAKYLTKSRNVVHSVKDQLSPVTRGLQDLQREVGDSILKKITTLNYIVVTDMCIVYTCIKLVVIHDLNF